LGVIQVLLERHKGQYPIIAQFRDPNSRKKKKLFVKVLDSNEAIVISNKTKMEYEVGEKFFYAPNYFLLVSPPELKWE
jgi:hypothetical protein